MARPCHICLLWFVTGMTDDAKGGQMTGSDWLADQFEDNRTHLQAVALRMLGSSTEADDAVQEAWLRLSRSETSDVENLTGWLTTVVARICLDMLEVPRLAA